MATSQHFAVELNDAGNSDCRVLSDLLVDAITAVQVLLLCVQKKEKQNSSVM
jgi:hypothetical protein